MSEPRILSEYSPKILKINIKSFRPWIEKRITELSHGVEDEILWDLLYNYLEDAQKRARREGSEANPSGGLNGREILTVLSGFLGSKTATDFIIELFNLLKSAETGHLDGIPPEFGIKPEEAELEAFGLINESLKKSELKISDRLEREIRRNDRHNYRDTSYNRDDRRDDYRRNVDRERDDYRRSEDRDRDRRDRINRDRRDNDRHRDNYPYRDHRRDREVDHSHSHSHLRNSSTRTNTTARTNDHRNHHSPSTSINNASTRHHKHRYSPSPVSSRRNRSRSRTRSPSRHRSRSHSRTRRHRRSHSRSFSPEKDRTRARKSPIQSSDSDSPSPVHHGAPIIIAHEDWENSASDVGTPQAPKIQENLSDALQQALREKARQSLVKKNNNNK